MSLKGKKGECRTLRPKSRSRFLRKKARNEISRSHGQRIIGTLCVMTRGTSSETLPDKSGCSGCLTQVADGEIAKNKEGHHELQ